MKKLLSMFLTLILSFGLCITAFAETREVSPYEEIINSINVEFNLNLEYISVDESKISIEEYETRVRELAESQRELLDYIEMRKEQSKEQILTQQTELKSSTSIGTLTASKTVTKPTWNYGNYFNITTTYDVNGRTVYNLRYAELGSTFAATLAGFYLTNISNPSYSIIDLGETGTVKYTAILNNSIGSIGGVTLYAEFYYND